MAEVKDPVLEGNDTFQTEAAPAAPEKKTLSKKQRRKRVRTLIVVVVLLAAAFAAWKLLGGKGGSGSKDIGMETVQYGSITAQVEGTGTVKAKSSETLTLTTPGTVLDVLVADEVVEVEDNTIEAYVGDEIVIDALSDNIVAEPLTANERFLKMVGIEIVTGATVDFSVEGDLPAGLEMDENGSITGFLDVDEGTYQFTIVATHTVYNSCLRNADGSIVAVSMGPVNGVMTKTAYEIPVTTIVQ